MLSIVIPLYNDEKNIHQCLASLCNELLPEDEVIVVDNGSSDHSVDIVLQFQGMNVKLLKLATGTVGAVRNFGAQNASGNVLAFIDSDCLVQPGWRSACLQRLHSDETIAATGSKYTVPTNSQWFVVAWFAQRRPDGDVVYINSGNFIIKRSVFQKINGFDEALVTGEDAEICFRLRQAGYRIIEDSQIAVIHLGNPENLAAFYRQQKWHAIGMLGTVNWHSLDKPFLMTLIFGASIALSLILFLIHGITLPYIILSLILFSFAPFMSSLYRSWSTRSWPHLAQFFVLYTLYFFARLNILLALATGTANAYQRVK